MKTVETKPERTKMKLQSTRNIEKTERAVTVLRECMDAALRRGFFGTVTLELAVQDGTIQQLRRRIEELER